MERRRFLESLSLSEDESSYWIIFDENNPSTELEGGGSDKVRQRLRSKFKRCLSKNLGHGKAAITYLDENNSSLYADGTSAPTSLGIGTNMMVHFPKYYYRNEELGNNRYKLYVSDVKINNLYKEERECLVGVFEASTLSLPNITFLCSRPNAQSLASTTISDFYRFARHYDDGKKWGLIDYRVHKTIANMFCIMYNNTNISTDNSSIPCSGGTKLYNVGNTGGTLSLGNRDGKVPVNGDASHYSTNFLGLEDCYYSKWEFVQGVNVINRDWIVYDGGLSVDKNTDQLIAEGFTNVRTAGIGADLSNYITKIKHGEYADIVPTAASGGSATTYYADFYWHNLGNRILLRSGYSGYSTYCGVFTAITYDPSSLSAMNAGSRLGFYGNIEIKTKDEWEAIYPAYPGNGGGGGENGN